jgi:hypothetical protein
VQETLHIHDDDQLSDGENYSTDNAKLMAADVDEESAVPILEHAPADKLAGKKDKDSMFTILKNRPLVSAVLVYCTWSMHNMAYTEVLTFMSWVLNSVSFFSCSPTSTD